MFRSVFMACAIALVASGACGQVEARATAARAHASPTKARDWTKVVSATPEGGFVMGNPDAKVKLVEYGSLTCPHCRAFDQEGGPVLIGKYVKSGEVSWEFRNYVRDAYDVSAALIARCNGARDFFPVSSAIFKDQPNWEAKAQKLSEDQIKSMQDLPPDRLFAAAAKAAGLQQLAAQHGVSVTKSSQCLANQQSIDKLVKMANDVMTQYPDFPGTPTFFINGKMVERVFTWDTLEPALEQALGERG